MSRNSELNRLARRLSKREEDGAGALLPILIVGIIMVIVSASVALAVSYSSNISTAQIRKSNTNSSVNSLLNYFESDYYGSNLNGGTANPQGGTVTVAGVGSYKVYYSTASNAPASTSSYTQLASGSTFPTLTKWIYVAVTPLNGSTQNVFFSNIRKNSSVSDSAINWTGSVTFSSNSTVQGSPGVSGPVSVVGRESATTATTQKLYMSVGSVTSADVWSLYSTAKTDMLASTLRGNLASKSGLNYSSGPKIFGDVRTSAASSQIGGTVTQEGTTYSGVSPLPTAPTSQAKGVLFSTSYPTAVTLMGSDCSTPALLKSKLESYSSNTVVNVDLCATSSWATSIKPKANLVLTSASLTANLAISGLTVAGPYTVGIHSSYGFTLSSVKYIDGAKGEFISGGAGASKISSSNLTGAIANYGSAGGSIELSSTNFYYSPVASSLCLNAVTTSCTSIPSSIPHLIRVS